MRLSWAQAVAVGLTCAVVSGLLLLPGRLLSPDQPIRVAVPRAPAAKSIQAAPPLAIRHRRRAQRPTRVLSPPKRYTYVARPRTVVRVTPARRPLKEHRSAVISKLAPTAPLLRARLLTAVTPPRHLATPTPAASPSTAKTIATLAASLRKK